VRGDLVPAPAGDAHDRGLERGILERLYFAAVAADQVVMMVSQRVDPLEARDPVAEVDALHEAELVETVECSIDTRDSDSMPACPYAVMNLLRGQAAVLESQILDDGASSAATAPALRSHAGKRTPTPGLAHQR
jgi:hypothetical protein